MEKSSRVRNEWNYYVIEVVTSQEWTLSPLVTPYPPSLTVESPPTPYQDIHCLLSPAPLPPLLPCSGTDRSDDRRELCGGETSAKRLDRQSHHTMATEPRYPCNTSRPPGVNNPPVATVLARHRSKSAKMIGLMHVLRKGRPLNLRHRHRVPHTCSTPRPKKNGHSAWDAVQHNDNYRHNGNPSNWAPGHKHETCDSWLRPPHGDWRWNDGYRREGPQRRGK